MPSSCATAPSWSSPSRRPSPPRTEAMGNLAMLLDLAADAMGDRIAVGGRADGLTYAQVRRLAVAAAPEVAERSNGALAFAGTNGVAVPVALFAAAWAGASYAPLNYRLPPAQVKQLLDRLGSGYVVDGQNQCKEWLDGLHAAATDESVAYPDETDNPAILLFTS